VVTDDGRVFQLHAERSGHWVLDAIPDDLAPPDVGYRHCPVRLTCLQTRAAT
jgi:hypothetical protein